LDLYFAATTEWVFSSVKILDHRILLARLTRRTCNKFPICRFQFPMCSSEQREYTNDEFAVIFLARRNG